MTTRPDTATLLSAFRRDLDAAARLRGQFEKRKRDRDHLAEPGSHIIYAIDATALGFLFGVERRRGRAPSDAPQVPSTHFQVFHGSPSHDDSLKLDTAQYNIGQVILSYMLNGTQFSPHPLLLLPGHDLEAARRYDDLVQAFETQRFIFSDAKLRVTDLRKLELARKSVRGDDIRELTANLFSLLYRIEEPHRKFHAFNRLLRTRRLLRTTAAANRDEFQWADLKLPNGKHVLESGIDPIRARKEGSVTFWGDMLRDVLPDRYVDNDKLALSELDRINWLLRNTSTRVILFTTNNKIIEEGQRYRPFLDETHLPFSDATFSDLYLRHPVLLLDEPAFARPSEHAALGAGRTDNDDWIDTLLAPPDDALGGDYDQKNAGESSVALSIEHLRGYSDEDLARALERNPKVHHTLVNRWMAYLERLGAEHATISPLAESNLRSMLGDPDNPEEFTLGLEDRVKSTLSQLTLESWNAFFNTAADTGLELLQVASSPDQPIVYAVPLLVMRGGDRRRELLADLWNISRVRHNADDVMNRIGALSTDGNLENAYAQALAYGVLFAYMDRWKLTRLLAQRAIANAQTIQRALPYRTSVPNPEERIDGREAFYLLAVTTRVLASKVEEHEPARVALQEARRLLKADQRTIALEPEITGLRFAAEEVALESAIFAAEVRPKRSQARKSGALRKQILLLRDRIPHIIRQSTACSEARVQAHSRAMLRSEYFFLSFLVDELRTAADLPRARPHPDDATLAAFIEDQIVDLKTLYAEPKWLPLRARTLLRMAAALRGDLGSLPAGWGEPYTEVIQLFPNAANVVLQRDKRRLRRIEQHISVLINGAERPRPV